MTELSEGGSATGDHSLAGRLAEEAGRRLLALRADMGFADPRALRDAGDRLSHEYLMAALAEHRPADAVLSEEGPQPADAAPRLTADRVWIIDPLDGTREFAEEGRDDWAVHVALWEKRRLTAGAVALPSQGKTLVTAPDGAEIITGAPSEEGAPVSGVSTRSPLTTRDLGDVAHIRVTVSRTRPPKFLEHLTEHLDARGVAVELVPLGSAGAKIAAVLLGDVDVYVHAGGQYEWDSAAPVAVALAARAHASRVDGAELVYNREDPKLPDVLVCHPELAPMLLTGIRDADGQF